MERSLGLPRSGGRAAVIEPRWAAVYRTQEAAGRGRLRPRRGPRRGGRPRTLLFRWRGFFSSLRADRKASPLPDFDEPRNTVQATDNERVKSKAEASRHCGSIVSE